MGAKVGLWRALATALADTLYEMSGFLVVRVAAVAAVGDTTLIVESTDRWPATGTIAVAGETYTYSGSTNGSFTGLSPSLATAVPEGAPAMCWSKDQTSMDLLRRAFLVEYADGVDLDTLGRNYGLFRTRGLDDDTYRAVLKVWIYLDAGTIYAIEKILDALRGAGTYTIYEKLPGDDHKVYIEIDPIPSSTYQGKSYLIGAESQPRVTLRTVDLDEDPTLVYGIYTVLDIPRTGTNYVMEPVNGTLLGSWFTTVGPDLTATDEGQPVSFTTLDDHWKVRSYLDPHTVKLGLDQRSDGTLNGGLPDVITVDQDVFADWMVGHDVVIVSSVNGGAYEIAEVVTPWRVRLLGAAFVSETDVVWELVPDYTSTGTSAQLPRATWSGNTVTTPVDLPANVLVDYTTIPSAQAQVDQFADGTDDYPFYLFDETAIVQAVLDLITVAGVTPVVETS